MNYTNSQFIILILIGLYSILLGSIMETKGFASGFVFKFIPLVSGFLLGLIAFGVIK